MCGSPLQKLSLFIRDHMAIHHLRQSTNLVKDFAFPSEDLIRTYFLEHHNQHAHAYKNAINAVKLTTLSCDHTFQICSNVGYRRPDGTWVTVYDSLFVVMNESGQVADFQMVKSRDFDAVKPMFEDISRRSQSRGEVVVMCIIDNCCQWKLKLCSVFGEDTLVKLDIFHAVQRISKTLNRAHPHYMTALRDLRFCFRQENDTGKIRTKETPDRQKMLQNVDIFKQSWGSTVFTASSQPALERLKIHIQKGCLEHIPPGAGTNRNERLHRMLNNSAAAVPHIGPELMQALLSVMFYAWNHSRVSTRPCKPMWIQSKKSKSHNISMHCLILCCIRITNNSVQNCHV